MKLIIFDIDETLIHSCDEWIGRKPDFIAANKMIFVRPYAKELINLLKSEYQIAVWSAAYGQYLHEIIDFLFGSSKQLEFIWDRTKCELLSNLGHCDYFSKDLSKIKALGWFEDQFVIIDDRPENITNKSSNNVIPVKPYYGSVNDYELKCLIMSLNL
jgi:RNA polymerase II subunit A small phosphatase-like protein